MSNFFNSVGPCRVIDKCSYIDPAGRLHPCLTLDMGNVFDEPFESLWNPSRFRTFRHLIRQKGRLPLCIRCPA